MAGAAERLARPETPSQFLFREVNDQIRQIARRWGRHSDLDVLCECENGCFEHVRVTPYDYDAVRRVPGRYLLLPGHESGSAERVVATAASYVVVEKIGHVA
jgi:hypothetical protein